MRQYNLKEFELSQAYIFYWDKIEKANWFLENVLDSADEDLDSRLVQELLSSPVSDGGQWDMAANLVQKYGLVRLLHTLLIGEVYIPAHSFPSEYFRFPMLYIPIPTTPRIAGLLIA